MDIKVKNGVVSVPNFETAFQKIVAGIQLPAKQCFEISTVLEDLLKQKRILERSRHMILEKYAKKDKEGKVVTNDKNETTFIDNESRTKCLQEIEGLFEDEFIVKLSKKISIPEDFSMLPQDFMLLKDFISVEGCDEVEEVEAEEVKES